MHDRRDPINFDFVVDEQVQFAGQIEEEKRISGERRTKWVGYFGEEMA